MPRALLVCCALAAGFAQAAVTPALRAQRTTASSARKHVLAWADVRSGYQHDSISHAVATIERLGRESGPFEYVNRTDFELNPKPPNVFPPGTGIASGEQFNV